MNEDNTGFKVTWIYSYTNNNPHKDMMYWAWTFPYSFEQSLRCTERLMDRYKDHQEIYIHREVLTYSREERPMELITFTARNKIMNEREDLIEGLFPDANGDTESRPFKFDKKIVFISSRVHPGETPASYVLEGILNFLTANT